MPDVCEPLPEVTYVARFVVAIRADGEADVLALDGVDLDGHIYTVESFDEGRVRVELRGTPLPDRDRGWQLRNAGHALLVEADWVDRLALLQPVRGEFL